MTNDIAFQILFEKTNLVKNIRFDKGLHIIYGESNTGKSNFIRQLAGLSKSSNYNFKLKNITENNSFQIVFKNPENQIISFSIEGEIAFFLESNYKDHNLLSKKLKHLKNKYFYFIDWQRHPSTLSGGELEILNLITALESDSNIILIDDGLSYLSCDKKEKWVDIIKSKTHQKVVLWLTSDIADINYSGSLWHLKDSDLSIFDNNFLNNSYHCQSIKGCLSLVFHDFSYKFEGSEELLINSLNFKISNFRSLGLLGTNGSGKTTIASLIAGIKQPQKGELSISLKNKKPSIGMLSQFPERVLGASTLNLFLIKLMKYRKITKTQIDSFISFFEETQFDWDLIKDTTPSKIPSSFLRMALISILFHCKYEVLILDEPTFGLGSQQKFALSKLLEKIIAHKHLILISHDVNFAKAHCDKIYNLESQLISKGDLILKV